MNSCILKGDILYSETPEALSAKKDSVLIIENGVSMGVYPSVPASYTGLPVHDYTGHLIIPGLVDLHLHAPQYAFRGMWMDEELLDWLNRHTFPMEARYKEPAFAKEAYTLFAKDIRHSATTRAVIYSTLHADATLCLADLMEETGIVSFVGKVNMDRNAPEILIEASAEESLNETKRWLDAMKDGYRRTYPILTPRFIPSCSDALLEGLGELAKQAHLPVQSHLSENHSEIAWVKDLCPWSRHYGDAYDRFGLFGAHGKAIMAHCNHSSPEEIALMKARGTFVAHCPDSNANLASGIAPVRRFLDEGVRVGLGSDVAGGATLSMFTIMREAIQHSKLRWRLVDGELPWLTFAEAFYLSTAGGGAFFGKVGSFKEGFEADALVLSEESNQTPLMEELTLEERLERFVYTGHEGALLHKYVRGEQLF